MKKWRRKTNEEARLEQPKRGAKMEGSRSDPRRGLGLEKHDYIIRGQEQDWTEHRWPFTWLDKPEGTWARSDERRRPSGIKGEAFSGNVPCGSLVVAEAVGVAVGGTLGQEQTGQSFWGPVGPWEWWVFLLFLGDKVSRRKSSVRSTITTSHRVETLYIN